MKQLLLVMLTFGVAWGAMAKVAPAPWDLPAKPVSTITYSYLITTDHVENISYTVGVDQPNTVDYRVVVGLWTYYLQWVQITPSSPLKTRRWEWGYRYYVLILPAGQTTASTYWDQWTYDWRAGEAVDIHNYYVSFYGPN